MTREPIIIESCGADPRGSGSPGDIRHAASSQIVWSARLERAARETVKDFPSGSIGARVCRAGSSIHVAGRCSRLRCAVNLDLTSGVDGGLAATLFDGFARRLLLLGYRGTTLPAVGNQLSRNVSDDAAGWKISAREEWGNRKIVVTGG